MTTQPKHTPGEWKTIYFDAYEIDDAGFMIPAGYKKRVINSVRYDEQNRRCTQFLAEVHEQAEHPEQGDANARLMTAAPKLLEAIRNTLEDENCTLDYERQVLLWAAITEATGEEPKLAD